MSKEYEDIEYEDGVKGFLKRNFSLVFSVGSLVLNMLIFALVLSELRIVFLVLAGAFAIYFPIALFSSKGEFIKTLTRILEAAVSVTVSFAVVFLFEKYALIILPIIEIVGAALLYFLVLTKDENPGKDK